MASRRSSSYLPAMPPCGISTPDPTGREADGASRGTLNTPPARLGRPWLTFGRFVGGFLSSRECSSGTRACNTLPPIGATAKWKRTATIESRSEAGRIEIERPIAEGRSRTALCRSLYVAERAQ